MTRERLSLRARALQFLARREHSRLELQRKLTPHAEDPSEIPVLLDEFEGRGWLSEARFVEQTVLRLRERYGSRRVVHELREKGVSAASIDAVLPYVKESQLETAKAVLRRKYAGKAATKQEWAKQARFLQGRGFDYDVISQALDWHED